MKGKKWKILTFVVWLVVAVTWTSAVIGNMLMARAVAQCSERGISLEVCNSLIYGEQGQYYLAGFFATWGIISTIAMFVGIAWLNSRR